MAKLGVVRLGRPGVSKVLDDFCARRRKRSGIRLTMQDDIADVWARRGFPLPKPHGRG